MDRLKNRECLRICPGSYLVEMIFKLGEFAVVSVLWFRFAPFYQKPATAYTAAEQGVM